jgi:hypothetical protein
MADNLQVTQGTGTTVAADDIGGILHQRIKLVLGADGVNDGDVSSTNPIPTSVAALPLPSGAATEATLALAKAVLDLIKAKTDNLDVALSTRTKPADAQNIRALTASDVISVSGTVPVSGAFFQATQPVSNVIESASTGTITAVAAAVASFSILAANANRKGFIILNEGTSTVRIAFAATASTASTTLILAANQSYFSTQLPVYRGVISGISNNTNSTLRVTELT